MTRSRAGRRPQVAHRGARAGRSAGALENRPQPAARVAGVDALLQRRQRQIDQQGDARHVADQDDRAPQGVLEVGEALRRGRRRSRRVSGGGRRRSSSPWRALNSGRVTAAPSRSAKPSRRSTGADARSRCPPAHAPSGDRPVVRPTICRAISAAGFGPWSPAPWMRPESAASCARSARAIAFVQRGLRGVGAKRRHVPLVGPQRAARGRSLRERRRRAHRRMNSSSDRSSFGKVGVPVLPAIQSMSRQWRRRTPARTRGARCRRGGCTKGRSRSPRATSGGIGCIAVGQAPARAARFAAPTRLPTPRTDCTRCGRCTRARRSRPPRAWPSCRPRRARSRARGLAPAFRDDVDDPPPRHFSQSSRARPSGPAEHGANSPGRAQSGRSASARRACPERLAQQAAVRTTNASGAGAHSARRRGAAEQQIALAASFARPRAAAVPAERPARPARPTAVATGELVGAEHAIEEARRIGAHQLAAERAARRIAAPLHASGHARWRASARRRPGRSGKPPP